MKKLSAEHPAIDENVSKRIEQARSGNVCHWMGTSDCGPGNCDFYDVCPELALDKANARIRELEVEVGEMEADRDSETAWACEYLEAYLFHRDRADRLAVIADALAEECEGLLLSCTDDLEAANHWCDRANRAEAKLRELYGYLLQADKDGESNIPQELGNEIEEILR